MRKEARRRGPCFSLTEEVRLQLNAMFRKGWPRGKKNQSGLTMEEAHNRLLFGSHETSPIILIDIRPARDGDTVSFKSRAMTVWLHCKWRVGVGDICLIPIYVFPELKLRGLVISKNRVIMFCLPISTFMYLWAIHIFPGSVCLCCWNQLGRPLTGTWM